MSVRLVNDATALLSMRESDFDAYSAYGEVVDNSIEAEARNVRIHFEYESGTKQERIEWVAFGDDGIGMDRETLHRCLQLGYSSRYNSRSGIGRFGVGATLAAINQCQRVEVFSKERGQAWLFTYVDIEEMMRDGERGTSISEPVEQAPPNHLSPLAGENSGTIVVWRKYDRQPHKASAVVAETETWMGRTYRYFIWDGIGIALNGKTVPAVDPLYAKLEKTLFPEDPPAETFPVDLIEWPVSSLESIQNAPDVSNIEVEISLLPEALRPNQGAGNSRATRDRFIDRNEGISILRNGREVFYGNIPHWKPPFEELDRWWGCEIRFDAVLDRAFTVKNIKQGAVPSRELKQVLMERINPTRKTCREKVRDLWAREKQKRKEQDRRSGTSTGHEGAELAAKDTPTPPNLIDRGKDRSRESQHLIEKLKNDADDAEKAIWKAKFEGQPFTIVDDEWRGPHFFDTYHLGGSSILSYNSRHTYHGEIERLRQELQEQDGDTRIAEQLKDLIDILVMSYAKAEAMFDSETTLTAEDFSEQLRSAWGNYLKGYIRTWHQSSE